MTATAGIPRPVVLLLGLGFLTGTLAACGEAGTESSAPTEASPVTATAEDLARVGEPETTPPATAAPERGICPTGDLDVSVASQQGAAGSVIHTLQFTNISDTGCELSGFPGVSFVGYGDGTQVGAPAVRDGVVIAQMLPVAPGESVHADLRVSRAELYDPVACGEFVEVDGLRIYPPGNTESAFVELEDMTGCTSEAVELLTVRPVVAAP